MAAFYTAGLMIWEFLGAKSGEIDCPGGLVKAGRVQGVILCNTQDPAQRPFTGSMFIYDEKGQH